MRVAGANADRRYLALALALLLAFMAVEVVVGIVASSLALMSDAGHMLTDAAALALSLWTVGAASRPPGGKLTFGLRRLEVVSAQVNGATLVLAAGWFLYEGAHRLITPPSVDAALVVVTALIGIPVNLASVWAVGRANRRSLNVEGSFQHLLTDLYAFIGTAVAGGLILVTGIDRLDALAAMVVAFLMLRAGVPLLVQSTRIMLQAAPRDLDPDDVARALVESEGVVEVHDLHLWELTPGLPTLSAHVLVDAQQDCQRRRRALEQLLRDRFDITHTTLQMDHAGSELGAGGAERVLPCAWLD